LISEQCDGDGVVIKVEERTYSSLNPPPTSLNLSYSVSRFLSLAARYN